MQTANQSALETVNAKFAAGEISVEQYQELLATISQMSDPVAQPVTKTEAAPTALSDPSRRAQVEVVVSDDFTKGHLSLVKTRTGRNGKDYSRRFGIWAEQVTDLIVALSERFEELPEEVREQATAAAE
jgi:hypothetical protein